MLYLQAGVCKELRLPSYCSFLHNTTNVQFESQDKNVQNLWLPLMAATHVFKSITCPSDIFLHFLLSLHCTLTVDERVVYFFLSNGSSFFNVLEKGIL